MYSVVSSCQLLVCLPVCICVSAEDKTSFSPTGLTNPVNILQRTFMTSQHAHDQRILFYSFSKSLPGAILSSSPPPLQSALLHKSDRVVSGPHGLLVRFVRPALFSQVWRPVRGPGLGTPAASPVVALWRRADSSFLVVSGVRSS